MTQQENAVPRLPTPSPSSLKKTLKRPLRELKERSCNTPELELSAGASPSSGSLTHATTTKRVHFGLLPTTAQISPRHHVPRRTAPHASRLVDLCKLAQQVDSGQPMTEALQKATTLYISKEARIVVTQLTGQPLFAKVLHGSLAQASRFVTISLDLAVPVEGEPVENLILRQLSCNMALTVGGYAGIPTKCDSMEEIVAAAVGEPLFVHVEALDHLEKPQFGRCRGWASSSDLGRRYAQVFALCDGLQQQYPDITFVYSATESGLVGRLVEHFNIQGCSDPMQPIGPAATGGELPVEEGSPEGQKSLQQMKTPDPR